MFSTVIENTNSVLYCLVKSTYVAFSTSTLITTYYCSGTFLALHGTFSSSYPTFDHTHTITTITMTSTTTDDRSNNCLSLPASTGGPGSSNLGIYQQTSFGSGDVTIRTLVPAAFSTEPYHSALIAKLFFLFRQSCVQV